MRNKRMLFVLTALGAVIIAGLIISYFDLTRLIAHYSYPVLAVISVPEGPIATVISGYLVSQGVLVWYKVYLIMVCGDVVGDGIAYSVGRFAAPALLRKFEKFYKVTDEQINQAKMQFQLHHTKTLFFSKIIHGVGIAGLIAAGLLKINYKKYFVTCLGVSLLQSATLLSLGIFFSRAHHMMSHYLNVYAEVVSITCIIAVIIFFTNKNGKK